DLVVDDDRTFRYFVELDNGTEAVRSATNLDTWQKKIAFYERMQDRQTQRFRVLAVTTGQARRLQNILDCAASTARNPRRSLVYGVTLADFVADAEPLTSGCFLDHRGQNAALIPLPSQPAITLEAYAPAMLASA